MTTFYFSLKDHLDLVKRIDKMFGTRDLCSSNNIKSNEFTFYTKKNARIDSTFYKLLEVIVSNVQLSGVTGIFSFFPHNVFYPLKEKFHQICRLQSFEL